MPMWDIFSRVYNYLISLFWSTELDITLLGLQEAGKTCLLRAISGNEFQAESLPTVGFTMQKIQLGRVNLKCWDLGGQQRFRSMWERYCKDVDAVVFILDSASDDASVKIARDALHNLVSGETLKGIPLLVLGNKNDLPKARSVDEVIEAMDLKSIKNRQVSCYSISVKEAKNLNSVLSWLIARKDKR